MTSVLLAVGCTDGPSPTHTGAPAAAWSQVYDPGGAALSGVWGSGPDDVWMVGGDAGSATIVHGDGAAWSEVPAPDVGLLVWVFGFGPDDAIAVGVGGGAARWDGAAWSVVDTGTTTDLWGVWGAGPDDLWVVGGDPDAGEPLILHGDEAGFTPVPLDPTQNDRLAHALFKVFGVDGRVFAVGQYGLVVEWDGARFVQRPTGAEATDDFVSLWGPSADRLVVVGGRSNAQVATFDGTAFTTTHPAGVPGLSAVSTSDDEAVVGGLRGWVGHLDPAGAPVFEDAVGTIDVHAVWHDGRDRFYGVGGRFYEPYAGVALVREAAR